MTAWVTAVKHLLGMQQTEGIFLSSKLCLFAVRSWALSMQVNLAIRIIQSLQRLSQQKAS